MLAHLAIANLQLGRLEEALQYVDRSLLLNPAFAYALKDKAVVLERMGRRAEAVGTLRRLRAAEPSMSLGDIQASNLASTFAPEAAAQMNAALARLWPDASAE